MANIRVDLNYDIKDGSEIVFRSPVDCSAITGLAVYCTAENGATSAYEFALTDAHGQDVGNIDHLFAENVVVKVILDVTAGKAYVQNADTNDYIERTFVKMVNGEKPPYTAEEVGADPAGTAERRMTAHESNRNSHEDIRQEVQNLRDQVAGIPGGGNADAAVAAHNAAADAHGDIRLALQALADRINAALNSTDTDLDQLSEIVAYVKSNKSLIDAVTTAKVSTSDIVDNLTTNVVNKPLSAAQGCLLKNLHDLLENRMIDADNGIRATLVNYALASSVPTKTSQLQNDSGFLPRAELDQAVDDALQEARESGEFDGDPGDDGLTPYIGANGNWWLGDEDLGVSAGGAEGQRGPGILYVTTTPSSYTTAIGGQNPAKRMSLSTIKSEAGVDEVLVGDLIQHSYYLYQIYHIEGSYAYTKSGRSIRGTAGTAGTIAISGVESLPAGSAPTVTEASGSTSSARKYILGIPAGAPGDPGPGYELTDADRAAITAQVVAALPKYAGAVS